MTPFQILLITLTVAIFSGWFSFSMKKEAPKASNALAIVSGFAMLLVPVFVTWCIIHYINI